MTRCCRLATFVVTTLVVTTRGITFKMPTKDPWPTMRGPFLHQFGTSDVVVPKNLSEALRWSFHHPDGRFDTNICGGPVIDAENNLYLSMNDGIRKLSPDGQVLWHFPQTQRRFNNQASLFNGSVFSVNELGVAFSLDQRTGVPLWQQQMAADAGSDCGYPAAYEGVFVMAAKVGTIGGNTMVFGLAAGTGQRLWSFPPNQPVWNFEPLFTEDHNVVFMDFTGNMYSLSLHTGRQNWFSSFKAGGDSFSDGGATLGPNGAVYSCSNAKGSEGHETSVAGTGLLRAVQLSDGAELWKQHLPQPCNSYPAVGRVSEGSGLSVVVTPGSFMGDPNLHGSIMAFDAATGVPEWAYNTQPYTGRGYQARGDVEGLLLRAREQPQHPICLPAHWSSANIAGDGTVYAGRADGFIYGVRGPVSLTGPVDIHVVDFTSTPGMQVQRWDARAGFLHGAFAFAPGMVAASTCDTLYVFKA